MDKKPITLEKIAIRATRWIGSIQSLIVHTIIFIVSFALVAFGVPFDRVLLVLTTVLSLEAIYLSIFIQMSVNRSERRLHAVSKDIDEIQEDIEEISEDVHEMQEDIEEIEKDVDEIQEDIEEISEDDSLGEIKK
jgi:peptidoglycan hydrolase CwlO-like protein